VRAVTAAVVGEDALDVNTDFSKGQLAARKEAGRRPCLLVGQGLDVGVARVVVHGHVQAVIATVSVPAARELRREEALTTAVGYSAKLLNVEVHQFAWARPLVTHDGTRRTVQSGQHVEADALEDAVYG
jgi:hypothetical protein